MPNKPASTQPIISTRKQRKCPSITANHSPNTVFRLSMHALSVMFLVKHHIKTPDPYSIIFIANQLTHQPEHGVKVLKFRITL